MVDDDDDDYELHDYCKHDADSTFAFLCSVLETYLFPSFAWKYACMVAFNVYQTFKDRVCSCELSCVSGFYMAAYM